MKINEDIMEKPYKNMVLKTCKNCKFLLDFTNGYICNRHFELITHIKGTCPNKIEKIN